MNLVFWMWTAARRRTAKHCAFDSIMVHRPMRVDHTTVAMFGFEFVDLLFRRNKYHLLSSFRICDLIEDFLIKIHW